MKKNLYFILLIMSSLLAACKKEPKEEVVGYRFTQIRENQLIGTAQRAFLFLYDENGNVLKDAESQSNENLSITAEKDGNYAIGYSEGEGFSYAGTKYYNYDLVHSVPNNQTWNLQNSFYSLTGSEKRFNANLIIENLPNFDSIYVPKSYFVPNEEKPKFDSDKKELTYNANNIYAFDYTFLYIREHKDSSFRYELIKPVLNFATPTTIRLDYQKLRKTKVEAYQIDKNINFENIIVRTDKGLAQLFVGNYFSKFNKSTIILPQEEIKQFYVQCFYENDNSNIQFFDKIDDLRKIEKPSLSKIEIYPQPNGTNKYKLVGEQPILINKTYFYRKNGVSLNINEKLPYKDDSSINRGKIVIPKVLSDNFKDLNGLALDFEITYLYNFKDKSVTYLTFLDKLYGNQYSSSFNSWVYDVGFMIIR